MSSVTIAYNDAPGEDGFFESCGDRARDLCVNYEYEYFLLRYPNFHNKALLRRINEDNVFVIAAHGSADAIHNDNDNEFLSTRTINYDFKDKTLYCIVCSCGDSLGKELDRLGVKIFVGYKNDLKIGAEEDLFVECALSGLDYLLRGKTLRETDQAMKDAYSQAINDSTNKITKMLLLENRENIVTFGKSSACI